MSKGYAIYLAKDNRTLKVIEFPIQAYAKSQQLFQYLEEHRDGTVSCEDLKAAGFGEITGEWMFPNSVMGKSGCTKMADDAQIKLDDSGVRMIVSRMVYYDNYRASGQVDMNRLLRIDYDDLGHKFSMETIQKCVQHFYQLADSLQAAFADVLGISFEIGEEEAQYGNLFFRIFYKGRSFLHLLGKFGNSSFIHLVNSKQRFPQWSLTVHPFEDSCQLDNSFKDIHLQKVSDEEALTTVTESYDRRGEQFDKVRQHIEQVFGVEVPGGAFEFDLVRECVTLHEDAERTLIGALLPTPSSEDRKEFFKYTSLETFIKIFQNGTIRMNSVVAMNDTSETNILQDVIRNFKEPIESEADTYLASNTRFITSFSALEDSLPMWAQYGNKGTGVCLVFERGPFFKDEDLLKINYISKNDETVKKVCEFQTVLKEQGIHFYFALLDKYRNFIKYDFYKSEDEYRYLVVQEKGEDWTVNADYNLVAPYIDKRLSIGVYSRKSARKDDFPFILRRVILGPAMTNQKYNVWQLNYMASRKNLWGIKVEPSRIDNFR